MSWEDGVIDVLEAVVSPVVELLAWNNDQTQISFHLKYKNLSLNLNQLSVIINKYNND